LLIGAGSNPYWNESFVYSVNSDDVCELELKLMDADSLTQNDFLGGAK
jgi:Ca2+-dependent lipid-binding protein